MNVPGAMKVPQPLQLQLQRGPLQETLLGEEQWTTRRRSGAACRLRRRRRNSPGGRRGEMQKEGRTGWTTRRVRASAIRRSGRRGGSAQGVEDGRGEGDEIKADPKTKS